MHSRRPRVCSWPQCYSSPAFCSAVRGVTGQPTNTKLADQVQTVFRGDTLRSMLLNARPLPGGAQFCSRYPHRDEGPAGW